MLDIGLTQHLGIDCNYGMSDFKVSLGLVTVLTEEYGCPTLCAVCWVI